MSFSYKHLILKKFGGDGGVGVCECMYLYKKRMDLFECDYQPTAYLLLCFFHFCWNMLDVMCEFRSGKGLPGLWTICPLNTENKSLTKVPKQNT